MMSLVRLLGFSTLGCGCITGRYREVATQREIIYVEEKGSDCPHQAHRRNHTLTTSRFGRATNSKTVTDVPLVDTFESKSV